MLYFVKTDAEGFVVQLYDEGGWGARQRPVLGVPDEPTEANPHPAPPVVRMEPNPDCRIPADAVSISQEQWEELRDHPGLRRFVGGKIIEYVPPPVEREVHGEPDPTLAGTSKPINVPPMADGTIVYPNPR